MKQPLKRSNSPIFWVLFGGGGMMAALFGPALVLITGLAVPLGFMSGLMSYPRALAIAQNWVGKGFLFVFISLLAWHAAHRLLCSVHDFGIHKTVFVKSVFYGFALVVTLVAAVNLLAIGF
jgi:fumarate reductase subunit D